MSGDSETLPDITATDLQLILQAVISLAVMGACEIRIHPCRFPLIFGAMLRHGAVPDPEALANVEDIGEVVIPLRIPTPTGETITCNLMQWGQCGKAACEDCATLEANGPRYPTPQEQSRLWTPGN